MAPSRRSAGGSCSRNPDREGDRRFAKPTLLLRHGKTTIYAASALALVAGDALLLAALRPPLAAAMLVALFRAAEGEAEQIAIGIAARAGNGLLVSVLAWLALAAHGAPAGEATAFLTVLCAAFRAGFALLVAGPEQR